MDDGEDSDFVLPRAKRNKTTTKVLSVHKILWMYVNVLSPQKPLHVVISFESSSNDSQDADKVLFTCTCAVDAWCLV